jgi:O-antigen/teichoic acid export membrane protein
VNLSTPWSVLSDTFYRQRGDPLTQSHLDAGLGRRAARGAVTTVVTQWSQFVLQTGSTVVLARLLSPSEFGIAAMVTALIGIGDAFWNLGLQTATIRYKNVTHRQVTFFFWLQVTVGASLTALTIGCAHVVAGFYHNPKVFAVTVVYASYFTVSGLLAQHQAVLTRQMRFTTLAFTDVFAMAVGVATAITVASLGGSYWAIVSASLVTLVVRLCLYWWTSGWIPGRPRRAPGVGPMVQFGMKLALTNLLDYSALNADNVLIGHSYGSAALGLYSRAYNLLLMPINQIHQPMGRIAVPVLSYLQDQPARFRKYYQTALSAVAYLAMPLIATVAALSHEVIVILLGQRWEPAARIFQVLAIAGIVNVLRNPNGWVFTATGHAGRQAAWAVINRPIMILGFVLGLPWGAMGVAWAYTITNLVLLLPACAWAVKDTPLRLADLGEAGWRPMVLGIAAFLAASGCHVWLGSLPVFVVAAAGFGAAGVVMALAVLCWPAVRADVRNFRQVFVTARSGPGGGGPAAAANAADPADPGPSGASEPSRVTAGDSP